MCIPLSQTGRAGLLPFIRLGGDLLDVEAGHVVYRELVMDGRG